MPTVFCNHESNRNSNIKPNSNHKPKVAVYTVCFYAVDSTL